MKHSISNERMWQRCQRQYFLAEIMASPKASDSKRKEAQFLKNIDTTDEWIGSVVHHAIHEWLIPNLRNGGWVNTNSFLQKTLNLAHRQFQFSENRHYQNISKNKAGDEYCVLWKHFFDDNIDDTTYPEACALIEKAIKNLLTKLPIRLFLENRQGYSSERMMWFKIDGISIQAIPDLIMPSPGNQGLDIVDWKVTSRNSNYNYQVAVYALAALNNDGSVPYTYLAKKQVRCYVVNLLDDFPEKALENPYLINDEALRLTENLMFKQIQSIHTVRGDKKYDALDIHDFNFANSDGTCALCNLKTLCLEMDNASSSQPLPSIAAKTTQLALPID